MLQEYPSATHVLRIPRAAGGKEGAIFGFDIDDKWKVLRVLPGYPAQLAGLRRGDVVIGSQKDRTAEPSCMAHYLRDTQTLWLAISRRSGRQWAALWY